MEPPEKRNANSNEGPNGCQADPLNYFPGNRPLPNPGAGIYPLEGPGGPETLLRTGHAAGGFRQHLQPGVPDFLPALVTDAVGAIG
jgi:hypothetical protein